MVVGLDFSRGPGGQDLPVVKDGDAIGDRENHFHVVLDHEDRKCPGQRGDQVDDSCGFARRHSGGWLVQQQQRGLARESNRDFELTLFAV